MDIKKMYIDEYVLRKPLFMLTIFIPFFNQQTATYLGFSFILFCPKKDTKRVEAIPD